MFCFLFFVFLCRNEDNFTASRSLSPSSNISNEVSCQHFLTLLVVATVHRWLGDFYLSRMSFYHRFHSLPFTRICKQRFPYWAVLLLSRYLHSSVSEFVIIFSFLFSFSFAFSLLISFLSFLSFHTGFLFLSHFSLCRLATLPAVFSSFLFPFALLFPFILPLGLFLHLFPFLGFLSVSFSRFLAIFDWGFQFDVALRDPR